MYKAKPSKTLCKFPIVNCQLSEAVPLQPPVQRAAAEAQRFRGLAHVAVGPRHRLLDQESFDLLEAHVLHPRSRIAVDAEPQLAESDRRALRHQDAAFHGVVELADISRPRVIEQRLKRRLLEAADVLAVALRVLPEKMH